jgi:hypothetical protein
MTKDEAITEVCAIIGLAFHSLKDYSHLSDGFCSTCNLSNDAFRNEGRMIKYVRMAVVQRLKREGIPIAAGFHKQTGKELFPKEKL